MTERGVACGLLVALVTLLGCGPEGPILSTVEELGPTLTEPGRVLETFVAPAHEVVEHRTVSGTKVHYDYFNDTVRIVPTVNVKSEARTIPVQYGVTFKCQHGAFTIQRASGDLYASLEKEDLVDISYRERLALTILTTLGEDGSREQVETARRVVGYDFLTAVRQEE